MGLKFELNENAEFMALQAAKLLGLDIAGVDLLFDDTKGKKFRICEVNSSPGMEGFEKATGLDVPKFVVSLVRYKCGIAPPHDDEEEDNKNVNLCQVVLDSNGNPTISPFFNT